MKKYFPFIILLLISVTFFYKMFFFLKVPFPGDLLVSEYSPYKYESYLGYNPGSYPSKAQYFDTVQQMYPWKIFAIEQMKNGVFPLWNPYNFSGHPLFANGQAGVLNPVNLLFFIFEKNLAWSFYIYLQPVLLSIFTYIYLRKIGISSTNSIIGSVAFSYSLFMSVFLEYGNIGYSFLLLPLILFLVENIVNNYKSKLNLLLPFAISATFFSGHFQIAFGVYVFSLIYSLFKAVSANSKKSLPILIIHFILGIGISMIQILPTYELSINSARAMHDLNFYKENLLIQLNQLALYLFPDFYGNPVTRNYLLNDAYPGNALYVGIIPLVFAIYSLFVMKKNAYIKYFSACFFVILVLITNNPISILIFKSNISFISASSPSNFIYLISFSLIVMSSFGIDYYLKNHDKKIFVVISLLILLIPTFLLAHKLLGIGFYIKQIILSVGILLLIIISLLLSTITKFKKFNYLILIILIFDLFYYFDKFNPFVDSKLVYPETKIEKELSKFLNTRIWGYANANIEPNIATQLKLQSPEGYDPLYPKLYGEFIYTSANGNLQKDFDDKTRSLGIIINGYGEKDLRDNKYRQKVLDESGVGIIINRIENPTSEYTFDNSKYQKIKEIDGWMLFKNLNAKPLAYLATDIDYYNSDNQFEDKFFTSNSLMLDEKPNIEIENKNVSGEVKIKTNISNRKELSISSKSNSMLVVLQEYFSGWKAFVNGREVKIFKANYAFIGLPLESGDNEVELVYQPASFYWGLNITIISIVLTCAFFISISKYKK